MQVSRLQPFIDVEQSGLHGLSARYDKAIHDDLVWLPPPVTRDKYGPLSDVLMRAFGLELPEKAVARVAELARQRTKLDRIVTPVPRT